MGKLKDNLPWRVQSLLRYRPKSMIRSFEEYAYRDPDNCEVDKILDKGWSFLSPPKVLTEHIPSNFYKVIAQDYSSAQIYTIKKAGILMHNKHIGVITRKNQVIADQTFHYDCKYHTAHPFQSINKIPEKKHFNGKCLILAVAGGDTFYWHWMFDAIPKYGLVELSRKSYEDFDYILINENLRPFHEETLRILNIPAEKLMTFKCDDYFSFDEICVPSGIRFNPFVVHYLRTRFLPFKPIEAPTKNIYVSRQKARWRRILNEDEIFYYLEKEHGFNKVFFEDLSIKEQIELARHTRRSVSLVGSNQINMIFYPPGADIIEFQAKGLANVSNWIISEQCGHRYHYVECKEITDSRDQEYSDIVVNLEDLKKLL